MNWSAPLDLYCERLGAGLAAEPLNALTNLAFLVAALHVARRFRGQLDGDLRVLVVLLGLIGVGSLVFHTVATVWASVLDVAFIALYVVLFIHRALVRLAGWPAGRALGAVMTTIALSTLLAMTVRVPALNGSQLYLGPWLALFVLTLLVPTAASRRWLRWACALFALSMALRSVDLALCPVWPLGTHFGWHLNNALVLWCTLRALLARPAGRPAP